ncbi:MAG: AAA family ATPase [Methylocystis sp.]
MGYDAPPAASGGDFSLEPLEIVEPTALHGREVPVRRWIWDGWIPRGAVTALYGDGGTGKSLLAQQLMTACAVGETFLGEGVECCKVLGVFCEDDGDELHRRQAAINDRLGVSFAELANMRWLSRVGSENLLMTFAADGRGVPAPFFSQILNAARDFGARVVIIDTAADTFAGNENIRPQVRQFIALLTRLAREIDGAVVLLAHPSQTGKTSGSGDGGSTAWNNSVRSRLYFKRPEPAGGDAPDPDLRTLSRLKANYAAAGVDLTLRYESGAFIPDLDATGVSGGQGTSRQREAEEAFMTGMNELLAKGLRCNVHKGQANYAPKSLREKTAGCGRFSEEELTGAMNRLIKAGRVESIEEGPPSRRRSFLQVVAPDLPGV